MANDYPQLHMCLGSLENLPEIPYLPGYAVRSFREGDQAAWNHLREVTFPEFQCDFDSFIRTDASFRPDRVLFVVDENDVPVASTCAFFRPEHGDECGYIHMVMALPEHKGHGLGYAVVLAALRRLREEGYLIAYLTTDDFRLAAIKVYQRLGFQIQYNHASIPGRWAEIQKKLTRPKRGPETLPLWDGPVPLFDESIGQQKPSLKPFLLRDGKPHGAVIVFPGGGYVLKAPHEADPVAEMCNRQGFHAFVLDYRVAPYRYPAPLLDAQRAVRFVRCHAEELGVDPQKIATLGFSAGGHLCVMGATHYDAGDPGAVDPVDRVSCRPDAFVPCYAVSSFNIFRHDGSMRTLLGVENPDRRELLALSGECAVTGDTPPAFIWHTAEDSVVPVECALRLARALGDQAVPYSLHIFPYGQHGIGLGLDTPLAPAWSDLMGQWLRHMGF